MSGVGAVGGRVGPIDDDGKAAAISWYPLIGKFAPGLLSTAGSSSGGVTSKPILPLSANLIAFAFCCCCCC